VGTRPDAAIDAFLANGGEERVVVRIEDEGRWSEGLEGLAGERVGQVVLSPQPSGGGGMGADVLATAARWCRAQGALLVAEVPAVVRNVEDALAFGEALAESAGDASADVALYFPLLEGGSTAGAVAGVIARTSPWVAPAGRETTLVAERGLAVELGERDVRALEVTGVNALRTLQDHVRVWGGRTLSSDPEWKYVSLRRCVAFLERSIEQGTQWAVFEPNDEPLWRAIRTAISDFLFNQWSGGALLGATPDEAYFVRCDHTTMTAADVAAGRLVVVVGVAPVKPAEFVVITLQRLVLPWPPP
jgi:hypothetical protein